MAFDFPSSPSEGQIFNAPGGPSYVFNTPVWKAVGQGQIAIISDTPPSNPANGALWYESDSGVLYIWYNDGNSSQWVQVGGIMQPPLAVVRVQTFSASGTYVPHPNMVSCMIEAVGGGGAGGGANGNAGYCVAGGGGGSGSYSRTYALRATIGASQPVTVGGAGGGSGGNGGAGGNTSVGALCVANGGGGAQGAQWNLTLSAFGQPGVGGATGTGDVTSSGAAGSAGFVVPAGGGAINNGGSGGPGYFGGNAGGAVGAGGGSGARGGGGGGGQNNNSVGGQNGGNGGAGYVVITEYCSA